MYHHRVLSLRAERSNLSRLRMGIVPLYRIPSGLRPDKKHQDSQWHGFLTAQKNIVIAIPLEEREKQSTSSTEGIASAKSASQWHYFINVPSQSIAIASGAKQSLSFTDDIVPPYGIPLGLHPDNEHLGSKWQFSFLVLHNSTIIAGEAGHQTLIATFFGLSYLKLHFLTCISRAEIFSLIHWISAIVFIILNSTVWRETRDKK